MNDPIASVISVCLMYLVWGLFGLCVLGFLYLVYLGATKQMREEEPTEFGAEFDMLMAEQDEAAKTRARCRAHEAAIAECTRKMQQALNGPVHEPVEL